MRCSLGMTVHWDDALSNTASPRQPWTPPRHRYFDGPMPNRPCPRGPLGTLGPPIYPAPICQGAKGAGVRGHCVGPAPFLAEADVIRSASRDGNGRSLAKRRATQNPMWFPRLSTVIPCRNDDLKARGPLAQLPPRMTRVTQIRRGQEGGSVSGDFGLVRCPAIFDPFHRRCGACRKSPTDSA